MADEGVPPGDPTGARAKLERIQAHKAARRFPAMLAELVALIEQSERSGKVAAAVAQADKGVKISNCSVDGCNGFYKQTGDLYQGVPHYTNGIKHLFHRPEAKKWLIAAEFTPESASGSASLAATSVALPMGEHMWRLGQRHEAVVTSVPTETELESMAQLAAMQAELADEAELAQQQVTVVRNIASSERSAARTIVEVPVNGEVGDMRAKLVDMTGVPSERLFICEVYQSRVYKILLDTTALRSIQPRDIIFVYEMDEGTEGSRVQILNRKPAVSAYGGPDKFSYPLVLGLPKDCTHRAFRTKIQTLVNSMLKAGQADRFLFGSGAVTPETTMMTKTTHHRSQH